MSSKATIAALAAALLLLVANASERLIYAFSDLHFLVRIVIGAAFLSILIMLLLYGFGVIDLYQLFFGT